VKNIVMAILLLASVQTSFADDACELYLCLMGASESDGGSTCKQRIQDYTDKFKSSCPDLPTCIGTSGPGTSGVLMVTVSGSGGSTQGPENGKIIQVCAEEDTPYGTFCEIVLTAEATSPSGGNYDSCGRQ
jgi:hypothetical protein